MRRDSRLGRTVLRRVVGFHPDAGGHWVADLECGHAQHLRHDPPWQQRPWVTTPEGRERFLGSLLECPACAEVTARLNGTGSPGSERAPAGAEPVTPG